MADKIEYTLHVPARFNSGERVPRPYLERIEGRLITIAGGYNRARTVGAFEMSDGSTKREPIFVYTILAGVGADYGMRKLAKDIGRDLAQDSVLVTCRAIGAELI